MLEQQPRKITAKRGGECGLLFGGGEGLLLSDGGRKAIAFVRLCDPCFFVSNRSLSSFSVFICFSNGGGCAPPPQPARFFVRPLFGFVIRAL